MALITFVNNERLTLGSSKLVYEADEINSLSNVIDQAKALENLFLIEEEKIEQSTREGYDSGYEEGQSKGYEAALEHIAVKLVVLAKEANAARDVLEKSAGDIAIKIVEKIASEVGDKEMIAALARSAAKDMIAQEPIVLRVHPDNYEHMEQKILESEGSNTRIVDVIADPALTGTDCVLETEYGRIKADLKTQLKVLAERMYGG